MEHSEKISDLFKAMSSFRKKVKQPAKDAKNPFFKSNYVTLEGVQKAVDEALDGTGLSYTQVVSDGEKGVSVSTIVTHESGEYIETGKLTLPPTKNDAQGNGSAITYARRYQLSAAFGISSDLDDDGNTASSNKRSTSNQTRNNYHRSQQNTTPVKKTATDAKKQAFLAFVKQIAKILKSDEKDVQKEIIQKAQEKIDWDKSNESQRATASLQIAEAMRNELVKK